MEAILRLPPPLNKAQHNGFVEVIFATSLDLLVVSHMHLHIVMKSMSLSQPAASLLEALSSVISRKGKCSINLTHNQREGCHIILLEICQI